MRWNWNGLSRHVLNEENCRRWKLHNYTWVLLFSAGNHDRYKLCAIYSCHMSTKFKNCSFFSFQALCGSQVSVPLLGGERLALNLQDEVIKPSTVKRVVGKGLPNPKDPARRGDLIVNFDIVFPERLSTATRDLFRSHLPGKWNDHHYKLRNLSTLCYLKTNILVLQTLKKSRFYLSVLNYFILSCHGLTFFFNFLSEAPWI